MDGSTVRRVAEKGWKMVERRPEKAGGIKAKEKVGRRVRGRMTAWEKEEGEEMESRGERDETREEGVREGRGNKKKGKRSASDG
jgi:hypothetical protein